MNISKVWGVFFSPTKTSKSIVDAIISGISPDDNGVLDLTYPAGAAARQFRPDELVVIGVPVYAGRVAPLAVERLAGVTGNNSPAVLVVMYGNREYEDALIELRDLAEKASFTPVAGAAFIGEHSFSSPEMPIAQGRPDSTDLSEAMMFGRKIVEKVGRLQGVGTLSALQVPGCIPYKDSMGSLQITPLVSASACTLCGLCIAACPGGAITLDGTVVVNGSRCIFCCACIKSCPESAISIGASPMLEKRQWLNENCTERKRPELYI